MIERNVEDIIIPDLQAEIVDDISSEPLIGDLVVEGESADNALVLLLKLVTQDRVVQKVGEIREEIQIVIVSIEYRLAARSQIFVLHNPRFERLSPFVLMRKCLVTRYFRITEGPSRCRTIKLG
jgi:hypothetical protein